MPRSITLELNDVYLPEFDLLKSFLKGTDKDTAETILAIFFFERHHLKYPDKPFQQQATTTNEQQASQQTEQILEQKVSDALNAIKWKDSEYADKATGKKGSYTYLAQKDGREIVPQFVVDFLKKKPDKTWVYFDFRYTLGERSLSRNPTA